MRSLYAPFLALVLSVPLDARINWRAVRKWATVGACAASGADAVTTLRNNRHARAGLMREANPLFARADGTASPVRLIGVKSALCGLTLALDTSHPRVESMIAIGTASAFGGMAVHNHRLGGRVGK